MKRSIGWQKFLLLALSLLLLIGAAGCKAKDTTAGEETKDGKTKLTIWLWPGMGIEDQIKQYAKENNIEVDIQLSEFADVHSNLTTSLAAGSGAPDISAVEVKGIDKMKAAPDAFYNLYDLGADELKDNYLDWKWKQAETPDGKNLLGIPTDIGPQALAYRVDLFEQAGLPTDREEVAKMLQTWDDYIKAGEQMKEKTGKAMIDSPNGIYAVIEGQGNEKYYDEDGNVIVKDNPQIKKAYDYAMQTIEKDLTAGFTQFEGEWGSGMANGDFATVLAPAWMQLNIMNNAPDTKGKWDITLLPEGAGNWGGSFLTIPKESKNAEEAYKLIKWVLSPEQQLETFKSKGLMPSTPGIYEDEAFTSYTSEFFNNAPTAKIYGEAAKQVKPIVEGPDSIQIEEIMGDAVERVRDGKATPDKSWKTAMDQLERELSR
ncbi:ABC transporter substrate-binding protein [Mesobacillus foraminis]|uniref:Cellobiose transport system substrate-binding protein n=1 Tax=Mesobacillus foraminis TaxID=279826 RepID=A0A4R2B8M2_9BACI|nr:extracellular solute-binding protein [Mesobacillus foraminis]TCN22673.1 cellobiose transport system substrate-binding protein [Mesobacillus foraminis]